MTEEPFDPHSAYLNLPPGERPPHHYALLGLELFCSHHERIHLAVRKQFRLIKRYDEHPDRPTREAIQDIMNAIATARLVLTDPERKQEYDIALANRLGLDRDAYLAPQVAAPLPEFELVVIAGPTRVRSRFDLIEGTPFTIGSDLTNILTLDRGRLADRHCVVNHHQGRWIITPDRPDRPIIVNDHVTNDFALAHGDRIDVGGYRLLFASRAHHAQVIAGTPPPLSLIIQKGPSIPTPVFNLLPHQRAVIGHADVALWQLPDDTVSRLHCAIRSEKDKWEIEDLNSTNGTRVNSQRVTQKPLDDRDLISLGKFDITVSLRY